MGGKLLLAVVLSAVLLASLYSMVISGISMPTAVQVADMMLRNALWEHRTLDVMGQLALLLTGTYGVLVLIRERQ
ncbi:MAG: hypothetical protein GX358_00180 [candidate division WS1 bacterium]|nr:hypothetical protein [candidate division WS1 bacterium]